MQLSARSGDQGMRAFPVRLPSGARDWTVLDEDLAVVAVADSVLGGGGVWRGGGGGAAAGGGGGGAGGGGAGWGGGDVVGDGGPARVARAGTAGGSGRRCRYRRGVEGVPVGAGPADRVVDGAGRVASGRGVGAAPQRCAPVAGLAGAWG